VLIDVKIALVAVGGLGETILSNSLYTYSAVTKEESLRYHVFTILQPISEAVSHNTNDKNQEQQKSEDDGHEHRHQRRKQENLVPQGLGKQWPSKATFVPLRNSAVSK